MFVSNLSDEEDIKISEMKGFTYISPSIWTGNVRKRTERGPASNSMKHHSVPSISWRIKITEVNRVILMKYVQASTKKLIKTTASQFNFNSLKLTWNVKQRNWNTSSFKMVFPEAKNLIPSLSIVKRILLKLFPPSRQIITTSSARG